MAEAWGCEKSALMSETARCEIEGGVMYIYDRCLVKYIPMTVIDFITLYNYHTKFPGAVMPSYSEVSSRFLQAWNYYESYLVKYKAEVAKYGN